MAGTRNKVFKVASSHLITSCATVAAILMFVGLGSQVLPPALGLARFPADESLKMAFVLNIAIILFGWRRAKDLKNALEAYEDAERLAERNANTDSMTGLANRRELLHCLEAALEAKRTGILLLIDLDHFKRVNDLHGHLAGDHVLKSLAETLVKTAPAGSCCARIGGDEFAVLLDGETAKSAEKVAAAILERLASPLFFAGAQLQVSASIGLASTAKAGGEEDVLRQSDVALYAAKRAGRNQFAWFDRELERELTDRLSLEEEMRAGILRGEFIPFFQPLIDLASRDLVGFETLARWRSPKRGLLEAEHFIEIAEATGLIGPLTMSVIEQALKEARTWPQHLKIAVNISPIQFREAQLAEQIIKLLTETGFPAHRLEIEITEASLLEDRAQVLTIIRSLKNLGVSVSLDDFGTGYASLAQVNLLPVDRIKIDKSFISTIVKSDKTAAIVSTIANLGHTLNVPITAEGVESEQVRSALQQYGCAEAQGWLFGRAVSAESVRSFLGLDKPGEAPPAAAQPKAEDDDPNRFTPRVRRSL